MGRRDKALTAVLLLLATAAPVRAQVGKGATMCACPTGGHKPLGTAASCEVACYGASGGGPAAGSGAQIGQALGTGIVNMMNASRQRRTAAEQQLRVLQQQQSAREAVEAEARKERLLDQMRDVEGATRSDDAAIQARARDLHGKEVALRRAALARMKGKPEETWCKLHLPQAQLMPQRPANDAMGRYPDMIEKFRADCFEWDNRCGGPAKDGPTALDKELSALAKRPLNQPKNTAPGRKNAPAAPTVGGLPLMEDEEEPAPKPKRSAPRKRADDSDAFGTTEVEKPEPAHKPLEGDHSDAFELPLLKD